MTTRRTALSLLGLGSVAGVAAPLAARVATQLPAVDGAAPPHAAQAPAERGIMGRNRDIVEKTKSHPAIRFGMMARWSHQSET